MSCFARLLLAASIVVQGAACDAPRARLPVETLPVKVVLLTPCTARSQQKMVDAISALGSPLEAGAASRVLIPRVDVVRADMGAEISFSCRPPRRSGLASTVRAFWGKGSDPATLEKNWRAYIAGSDSLRTLLSSQVPESHDPIELEEYLRMDDSEIRYVVSTGGEQVEPAHEEVYAVSSVDEVRQSWTEQMGEPEEAIPTVAVIFWLDPALRAIAPKQKRAEPAPKRTLPPNAEFSESNVVEEEEPPVAPQDPKRSAKKHRPADEGASRGTSVIRMIRVPAQEPIVATLEASISTRTNEVGEIVVARVLEPIEVDGCEVIPAGSQFRGQITLRRRAGKIGGKAKLAFEFIQLVTPDGQRVTLPVQPFVLEGESTLGGDVGRVAAGALVGATVGESTGKKKAAEKGAAIGAAVGVLSAVTSSGNDIELARGTRLDLVTVRAVSLRAECAP